MKPMNQDRTDGNGTARKVLNLLVRPFFPIVYTERVGGSNPSPPTSHPEGMRMRVFAAAAIIAFLAGPAYAQTQHIPKYGEVDKDKTPQQIESEREAERAYKRSLGNIPDQGPTDPWGNVRSEGAPKAAAKAAPSKRTKPDTTN
jgi:hypothetical protein